MPNVSWVRPLDGPGSVVLGAQASHFCPRATATDSMGGGGKPNIDELYEVDIVQCQADGTEVWGKLLINSFDLTWKDDRRLREAPSTCLGCLQGDGRDGSLFEAVPGATKHNEELLYAAIKVPMAWDKKAQEFRKAIEMDPHQTAVKPPHLQPGGKSKPPVLPAVHSIYCLGRKLEGGYQRRIHAAMVAGRPLILLGEGETYDRTRWAPIAGTEADPPILCTVS